MSDHANPHDVNIPPDGLGRGAPEDETDVTELHQVYSTVLAFRNELNAKLDEIQKQLALVNVYMASAETREKERNVPARLDGLSARIDTVVTRIQSIEEARKTDLAQGVGKKSVGETAIKVISLFGAILAGILAAIEIFGGK